MEPKSFIISCIGVMSLIVLLFTECKREQNQTVDIRLQQFDALLHNQPEVVCDCLRSIEPEKLSPANKAYYGLIKTIADDKTYTEFFSDSLITETEQYYNKWQHGSMNHIRSLVYKGVVTFRLGDTDSTAYIPLKNAERLFLESNVMDPYTGYMIYYYLGDSHYHHNNYADANYYYTECLRFARMENNRKHVFDAYTALFWNEMTKGNYEAGKKYLDTLLSLAHISKEEEYNLLNMQSVYYVTQGDFSRSLQCEKRMMQLLPFIPYHVDGFRTLFSISNNYKNLNQLDSALYYGLQAIQHIKDSTYKLNYLLYKNVVDIARQSKDYQMADEYGGKMFDVYQRSVNDRIENRILELEKLYDLTDAENKALKAETNAKIFTLISFLLLLMISFILYIQSKRKKTRKLKEDKFLAERLLAESKLQIMENRLEEQKNIIGIYSSFLTQYSQQQQQLSAFETKLRGSQKKKQDLANDFNDLLKQGQEQFKNLSNELFLSSVFKDLIHLPTEYSFLTTGDRLLLVMLALKLDNSQIAAFMNVSPDNLKSRKTYLKKKLKEHAALIGNFEGLISLF